jgi:chemotaxis protein MotB
MRRHKLEEEHVNHERWLVSYADFITLLFAFFVVMYSISQVNEGKYRVLSNTLTDAFNKPRFRLTPIPLGDTTDSSPASVVELDSLAIMPREGQGEMEQGEVTEAGERETASAIEEDRLPQQFRQIREQVASALGDLMRQQLVTMRGNEQWLEIGLASSMLFGSGDATLSAQAQPLLTKLAAILREQPNAIRVEGFTDNVPIANARFPSNWELSAARAVSVVQFLISAGLQPARLMAVGYGEYHPVADNLSESGRALNRRVVLMISASSELRPRLPLIAPARLQSQQKAPESAATQMPQVRPGPVTAILPTAPAVTRPEVPPVTP